MSLRRTERLCNRCGKSFYGNVDSLLCPECAQIMRAQNVVRERICIDCGALFKGGPRAKRCPDCRKIATSENSKHFKENGPSRTIGSEDICKLCGNKYIVKSSRQKYCSADCQRTASLEWQREHKREYNKRPEIIQARKTRRSNRKKICVYCLRTFWSSTATAYCSDYCRKQQKRIYQYQSDIKRGYKMNLQALVDTREEYRKSICCIDSH